MRLLRVIQEREFTPIGETSPAKVDVRIIAATNVDLKEAVKNGQFREDLYYRLSVVPDRTAAASGPPRRHLAACAAFYSQSTPRRTAARCRTTISPEVLSLLENYNYPGNVRELENIIERAVVIAPEQ